MILRQHVTFLFVLFFAPAGRKTTHKDEKCAIRHALRHVQGNLRTNGSISGVLALFLTGAQALDRLVPAPCTPDSAAMCR